MSDLVALHIHEASSIPSLHRCNRGRRLKFGKKYGSLRKENAEMRETMTISMGE